MGQDVLVVGSLHLDVVVRSKALPAVDETVRGSSWRRVCGGKGGNQACWASRLGASTAMISRVGDDDFGKMLVSNLRNAGVDTSGVSVDSETGSGMSVAIIQDDGEYGAVIVSGSNLKIAPDSLEAAFLTSRPRIVVLQNEIEPGINLTAARLAKSLGSMLVYNAAPARAPDPELAALTDILVVNRIEAGMMSGMPVTSLAEARAALPVLSGLGRTVVVTLGSLGLIVREPGQQPLEIPPLKIEAVSAHGAGDCFIGKFVQSLSAGTKIKDAAEAANATAAAFVSGQLAGT